MSDLSFHVGNAADYPDYVRLFAELQIPDPPVPPEEWAAAWAPHSLFLASGGSNVAYALAHAYGATAHVFHLAVDGAMRRKGLGSALFRALGARLLQVGCTRVRLNVKAGNDAAIQLYAGLGLEVHHRAQVLRLPWSAAGHLPHGVADVRPVDPAEDAALERRHDLLEGQIARWRERDERLFVAAGGDGFARFVPGLGAMPFCAPGTGCARALLEAMRPHAPPAASHLQLVIEAQDDLALALRDAGATLLFEIFQMRGPMPR